ncbi:anthranilate synthase component I [Caproicibacter sp.]|uniref:anthranilate synthase component I n=1 Tax=Caproicibacter sp. TaxID=2814884 RepID=UPI003989C3BD
MLYPPIETVTTLLQNFRTVPVFSAELMDCRTPVGIFAALKENSKNCFLLESVEQSERWGRYSFIGVNPKEELVLRGGAVTIRSAEEAYEEPVTDPAEFLAGYLKKYRSPHFSGLPRFTGGLAGYFGYDILRYLEPKLGRPPRNDLEMPDSVLHRYDEVVAIDHLSGKAYVILHIDGNAEIKQQYGACEERAKELFRQMGGEPKLGVRKTLAEPVIRSNISKQDFIRRIETAKRFIRAGDIFQVVPSRRFEAENPPDAFSVYRMLRATNPSPYLYYFQAPDYQIAGASPEMLVRVEDGVVMNKPIAGTSPRGRDETEDRRLERELLRDEKECAEHAMLVDLGRNDVGRVSKFGTVKVCDFMHVERASRVMHLVSEVHGELREDKTAVDALFSVLPAGTLSGAPKIRAMQIIDELEPVKRGVYGGAIGYLGFDGNADTCIAIRTALFHNGKAYVQAGMGIVADSDPEKEYEESANKAQAVLEAIRRAAEL